MGPAIVDVSGQKRLTNSSRIGFTPAVLVVLCLGVGLTLRLLPSRISPPFSLPDPWGILLVSLVLRIPCNCPRPLRLRRASIAARRR
jgi:hypothetical protein